MDRYVDNRNLEPLDEDKVSLDDLLFFLLPCAACSRNPIRKDEDCYLSCRYKELWSLLINKYIKTK